MTENADRYVLTSKEVVEQWKFRTMNGRLVTAKWGDHIGHEPDSDRDVYEVVFTATDDGKVVINRSEYEELKEKAWMYDDLRD